MNESDLRQKALAKLGSLMAPGEESQRLLHELRVHQIELEMQNDELARAMEELDKVRSRYSDLYDQAPVGYCTLSHRGQLLDANRWARKILGLTRTKLENQLFSMFVAREDQDKLYVLRKHLAESGSIQECELRIVQADGTTLWTRLTATKADTGPDIRLVLADISDRKRADDALGAETQRMAFTLQSIADGVVTTDSRGTIISMNLAAAVLCGWPPREAQGKTLETIFPGVAGLVRKVLSQDKTLVSDQIRVPGDRDGSDRWIAASAAPIHDGNNKSLGVVLVLKDETVKQKMADTLQRTDKLESLGVLAGGIAHDFNNLLGGIFGFISLARDLGNADPLVIKYLDKTQGVFRRAKALTQQLMTFSTGGAPRKLCGMLGPLVRETATFALSGSKVTCEFDLAADLRLCDFDENQIGQVVDNLVINAWQAMPHGGTIRITARNLTIVEADNQSLIPGDYVKITVADQGIGIPEANLANIFDPFFTTKKTGHGLGLATCHSILMKHNGLIEAESEPGNGSSFHFYLPVSVTNICQDQAEVIATHRGSGTILILDDEDFLREILGEMLVSMGYGVIEAKTGKEALNLCGQRTDLKAAILDLTIRGGMGGLETQTRLKTRFPTLPVFAVSGFFEDPIMAMPTEFGFTDSLRKPFQTTELANLLEKHLGSAHSP